MARRALWLGRPLAAALSILLGFHSGAAAEPDPSASDAFEESTLFPESTLSVRQSGGVGAEKGILSRLRGPAAVLDVKSSGGEMFRSLAGAMEGAGGKQQGYIGATGHGSLLGFGLAFNYVADERGGSATEARAERPLGPLKLGLSQTWNDDFESDWTGHGDGRALGITEGSVEIAPHHLLPLAFAVRETTRIDGSRVTEFRSVQTLMLGAGMVVNSTSTEARAAGRGATSGSVLYYGPAGPVQLTVGVDYGGIYGTRPGVARFGIEKSIEQSWSMYGYGERVLEDGFSRFDVGAVRQLAGFNLSAFAGGANDGGGAYAGLRVTVPLSAESREDRWLGF